MTHTALVQKRKAFDFEALGLKNPSKIESGIYDQGEYLCPWGKWQSNLNADYLVIGQDWGDENYYTKEKGVDNDKNPTCVRLQALFKEIGIDIGLPQSPAPGAPVYLTNAILGIKEGGMSAQVKDSWIKACATEFLAPLIEILQPKYILTLGRSAYKAMQYLHKDLPNGTMPALIAGAPYLLPSGVLHFAMAHCGNLGVANRGMELQKGDWKRIKSGFKLKDRFLELAVLEQQKFDSIAKTLQIDRKEVSLLWEQFKEERETLSDLRQIWLRKTGQTGDFDAFKAWHDNCPKQCEYCGIQESEINQLWENDPSLTKRLRGRKLEIERKAPELPYTELDNLVFSCYWCNNAKTDTFSYEEFKSIGNTIRQVWKNRLNNLKSI